MKTDYIELRVYDDGDVALTKRAEPSLLTYGIDALGKLKVELRSYGCEDEAIDRSVAEVVAGGYGEETIVK